MSSRWSAVPASYLEEVVALPRSEAADELDERGGVCMRHALVHVDAHLVDAVDKLEVQCRQQVLSVQ